MSISISYAFHLWSVSFAVVCESVFILRESLPDIDVKKINLQIKKNKNMFFTFMKNSKKHA